jgi:hypothetical protein
MVTQVALGVMVLSVPVWAVCWVAATLTEAVR